jgi:hypothetical protein
MKYDPNTPPPDPNLYTLVKTKEGWFYRKKPGRGGKGITMNSGMQKQSRLMKEASPATARLRRALAPYEGRMVFGRFGANVSARIRRALTQGEWPDYGILRNYHFQPGEPFDQMMRASESVRQEEGQVNVRIRIPEGGAAVAKSGAVTRYRFSLLLVAGDPVEKDVPLETSLVEGPEYAYGMEGEDCLLTIPVPVDGRPWMVCLRLTGYEGKEVACAGRHSGMKVISWG